MNDTLLESPTEISTEDVDELRLLPRLERAAALSHLVYIETIKRPDVDWSTILEDKWKDLNERAQLFNRQLIETWADNEQLFDLWISTIKEISRLREARRPSKALIAGGARERGAERAAGRQS